MKDIIKHIKNRIKDLSFPKGTHGLTGNNKFMRNKTLALWNMAIITFKSWVELKFKFYVNKLSNIIEYGKTNFKKWGVENTEF